MDKLTPGVDGVSRDDLRRMSKIFEVIFGEMKAAAMA